MSSTWSSGHGKFIKKDPNHGIWGKKIKKFFNKFKLKLINFCGGPGR